MSTVKSKKLQVGTDATSSNNFTIAQPNTPNGTLEIGVGNADSYTKVGEFNANGYKPATAPSFRATMSANQAIAASTWTKITFDTEEFDTTSDYDSVTNYRFTPSVSGYYMINAKMQHTSSGSMLINFYKNGSSYAWTSYPVSSFGDNGSMLVYLNGSSDYIECFGYRTTTGTINSNPATTYFSGILIQQA